MSDVLSKFRPDEKAERKTFSKKLKVGIIGTGWIAESHAESYLKMDDVEIVALADLIPGKAEKFAAQYGIQGARFYPDHKSMLEQEALDAVSVCTYNATHCVCTVDALKAGVNVLLEKPMTVTLEEALAIRHAEKESGKIVDIGFQPRYEVNFQMIKRVVQSGALGDVYYIQTGGGRRRGIPGSTFIEKKTGGIGALGDIGCYALDVVLNAIGYPKPLTVPVIPPAFLVPIPLTIRSVMHPDLMLTILRQRLSVWKAVSSAIFGFLGPCIWTQPAILSFWERKVDFASPQLSVGTAMVWTVPLSITTMWAARRLKRLSLCRNQMLTASSMKKFVHSSTPYRPVHPLPSPARRLFIIRLSWTESQDLPLWGAKWIS